MILIKKNNLKFLLVILTGFVWNCSSGDQEDAVKILREKQAQELKKDKKELNELIDKVTQLEDSLKATYSKTKEEKKQLEVRLKQINNKEQQISLTRKEFAEQQRQESVEKVHAQKEDLLENNNTLEAEKEVLRKNYTIVEDSLAQIEKRIADLSKQKHSILQREEFTSTTRHKSKARLTEGVAEIDFTLDALDKEKLKEQEKVNLNEKKISIVEKKISALEQEKDLYEVQKNDLMRQNATEKDIKKVDQQITQITHELQNEQTKHNQFRSGIDTSKGLIQKIDIRIGELRKSVEKENNEQELLGEFFDDEVNRIAEEKAKIEADNQQLLSQKEKWNKEKINLQKKIAELDTSVVIQKTESMTRIDLMVAALEKEETEVTGEEVKLLEEKIQQQIEDPDTVLTAAEKLVALSREISDEKAEIKKEREELLNEKEEAAEKKEASKKTLSFTIGFITVIVVLVIAVLYFLGKKMRTKK